jgi:hypothetical protein
MRHDGQCCDATWRASGAGGSEGGQFGIAAGVRANLQGGQVAAEPVHHRGGMGIGVRVNADHSAR